MSMGYRIFDHLSGYTLSSEGGRNYGGPWDALNVAI